MVFLMDTCSLAAGGGTWLFQASTPLDGLRKGEKLDVLVPALLWLCFQTHLDLSREHCDALSRADLSSPSRVKACIAAAEALSGCMNIQIQPGEWRAEIYVCRQQSHRLIHDPCCTPSTAPCSPSPAGAPQPLKLEKVFPGISSRPRWAALQAAWAK